MTPRHLVIMAAGTGGHIIPGLAVAAEMQRRGWIVSWLGTSHGMENKLVPPTGIEIDRLNFSGLRGKGFAHTVKGLAKLFAAFVQSVGILRRRSADAVLGMGGYVCLPAGLMAWCMRRPLMLVNADASLLMSNKLLRPFARRIAFGFDGAAVVRNSKAMVTGNPVRSEIEAIDPPAQRYAGRQGPLRLLVVGGSLGAQALNECLPKALALWPRAERPLVTHQTGAQNLETVRAAYATAGVRAETLPFINDMAACLSECDLIVCRAGAVTVSELCAAGVPAVLVPLVVSTTSHQRDNAKFMAQHGAAIHLQQQDLTPQHLFETVNALTRSDLLAMAEKAHALARPRAAERVADEIEKMFSNDDAPLRSAA